jgi:N-acetylneuraminate synthase
MVNNIRKIEIIMGDGLKTPKPSELKNRDIARKSLVAACDISLGDIFSTENIAIKRPGKGKSPMAFWEILGKKSEQNYLADEVIDG